MSNCKVCGDHIVDEVMAKIYYDEYYPLIDIGPYCPTCIGKIRICSGCHHPKVIDVDIRYFSKGNFYCTDCERDIEICGSCGDEATIYKVHNGKKYCESCFRKDFFTCGCCNTIKHNEVKLTDKLKHMQYAGVFKKYGNHVCTECFDREYTRFKKYPVESCARCATMFTQKKPTDKYCPGCDSMIKPCVLCGVRHHHNQNKATDDSIPNNPNGAGSTLCRSCLNNRVNTCPVCHALTLNSSTIRGRFGKAAVCGICSAGRDKSDLGECKICLQFRQIDDTGTCYDCNQVYIGNKCDKCGRIKDRFGHCRVCHSTQIYNYSDKPKLYFHYTKHDIKAPYTLFMGIENEVSFDTRSSCDYALCSLYANYGPEILQAKSDSSIDDYGYEIVTQPMSLSMLHKLDISKMFDPEMQKSRSCGMHIHVGRKHFSGDTHIFKLCQFIHNNEGFIDKVAGRCYNSYSGKFNYKPSEVVKRAKDGDAGRSRRVNLTNDSTVELRMFAGATREFEYRYRLEFVDAVVRWTKIMPVSMDKVDVFKSYVQDHQKNYPNLFKFLQSL